MYRTAYTEPFMADLAVKSMSIWNELEEEAGEPLRVMSGLLNFGDKVCPFFLSFYRCLNVASGRKDQCCHVLHRRYVVTTRGTVQSSQTPLSAVAVMVYALWTYHWRANSIRKGGRGPYDDRIGPVRTLLSEASAISLTRVC